MCVLAVELLERYREIYPYIGYRVSNVVCAMLYAAVAVVARNTTGIYISIIRLSTVYFVYAVCARWCVIVSSPKFFHVPFQRSTVGTPHSLTHSLSPNKTFVRLHVNARTCMSE